MPAFGQDAGFRHMVAFFGARALIVVADNAQCFKLIAVKFYDFAVVDVYDRFVRNLSVDRRQLLEASIP